MIKAAAESIWDDKTDGRIQKSFIARSIAS